MQVEGHDSSAPAGRNLICAAVSAMTEMTGIGMVDVCSIPVKITAENGRWELILPEGAESISAAQTLLETLRKALIRLSETQGGAIRVKE